MKLAVKKALAYAYFAGLIVVVGFVLKAGYEIHLEHEQFTQVFEIRIPTNEVERTQAYKIVQAKVALLERAANEPHALIEVKALYLKAWKMQMDYRLTEDDQIMAGVDRALRDPLAVSDWVLAKVPPSPTGHDILKDILEARKKG
jgi:hypothetical protein